jgi:hypothetical protein
VGIARFLAATLLGLSLCASASARSTVYPIPSDIAGDCSADVTSAIVDWIGTVPDGSTLSFGSRACYRIDGTLEVSDRTGLVFLGRGSTFRSVASAARGLPVWQIADSHKIGLHGMRIEGSYRAGGTFDASLQHGHGIDLRGSSVDIGTVTISGVAGDCVYFGLGTTTPLTRSSGRVHDSTCTRTGRNAVSVVAGNNILVQGLKTGAIGYDVFDVEPNPGPGMGSTNVRFDRNTIGPYSQVAYSIVESGPISRQLFTNNRAVGKGLKIAIADPTEQGFRPERVTITGNTSKVPQAPAAVNIDNVDGLILARNTIAMKGGPMAAVRRSCKVQISGNRFPGGSAEAVVTPTACPVPG